MSNTLDFLEKIHVIEVETQQQKSKKINVELVYDSLRERTELYDKKLCVVRRGTVLNIICELVDKSLSTCQVGVRLETKARSKFKTIDLSDAEPYKSWFQFTVEKTETKWKVQLKITSEAPIGLFCVRLMDKDKPLCDPLPFYIIYNPFCSCDPVYCDIAELVSSYLIYQSTTVFFGNASHGGAKTYKLSQFTLPCIAVCWVFLRKLKLSQRADPVFIAREITAFVNDLDDNGILKASWTKVTDGVEPYAWVNMIDIYNQYLKTGKSVGYGQCFIFAALTASIFRSLGVVCCTITGFNVGHDNNHDGLITIVFNKETLETTTTSETLWLFHCWNLAWMKRNDIDVLLDNSAPTPYFWQHCDATPQEKSEGKYQCGPFPIYLFSEGVYDSVQYDGATIYYSVNGTVKYQFQDKNGKILDEYIDKSCVSTLFTSGKDEERIEMTEMYRPKEKPQVNVSNKVQVSLEVEEKVDLDKPLKYQVTVKNSSKGAQTAVRVILEIRNNFGKVIEESKSKAYVFKDQNKVIKGEFKLNTKNLLFDPLTSAAFWEVRFYDPELHEIQTIKKRSILNLLFLGTVNKVGSSWNKKISSIQVVLRNKSTISLRKVQIMAVVDNTLEKSQSVTEDFSAGQLRNITINFTGLTIGKHKITVQVIHQTVHQEIGFVKSEVTE